LQAAYAFLYAIESRYRCAICDIDGPRHDGIVVLLQRAHAVFQHGDADVAQQQPAPQA